MAAKFWSASGVVEALGNSEFRKDGTLYSIVKLRGADGASRALKDVVLARSANVEVVLGATLDLLGIELDGKLLVYAVVREGEVAEDVAEVAKGKRLLARMGTVFLLLGVVMFWTLVIPLIVVPMSIRALRNAARIPSEEEMRRQIARHLAQAGRGPHAG